MSAFRRIPGLSALLGAAALLAFAPAFAQAPAPSSPRPMSLVLAPKLGAKVGACTVNKSLALSPAGGVVFATPLPGGVDTCGLPQVRKDRLAGPQAFTGYIQGFQVRNTGNLPVDVAGAFVDTFDNNYIMDVAGCQAITLAPGGVCSGTIAFCAFAGESQGAKTGLLHVISDAPASPHTLPVSGSVGPRPPAPVFAVQPSQVNFGPLPLGTVATPETVTVKNVGNGPLVVGTVTVPAPFTLVSNGCASASPLAANGTCDIVVGFTAAATPDFGVNATLSISHNAPFSPGQVGLSAESVALPGVTKSGAATTTVPLFDAVQQGTFNISPVRFTNLSGAGIAFGPSAVVILGAPTNRFVLDSEDCSNTTVASGGFCTAHVKLDGVGAPVAVSPGLSDSLEFTAGASSYPVPLNGTVFPPLPVVTATPALIDFGSVNIGGSSTCQQLTFTNTDTRPVTVNIDGPFTPSFQACAAAAPVCATTENLAPGQFCHLAFQFVPFFEGTDNGLSRANDGDLWWGSVAETQLVGRGVQPGPRLSVDNDIVSFGANVVGTPALRTVRVTNTGDAPLNVSAVSLPATFPPPSGALSVSSNCVAASPIAPGNGCDVNLTFTAPAPSTYFDTVEIFSNAVNGLVNIFTDGTGVGAPAPSLDFFPMSVSFGGVPIGGASAPAAILFANTGSAPMSIAGIAASGAFAGDFPVVHDCPIAPATLAVNDCCTIQPGFKPTVPGTAPVPENASLDISTSAGVARIPLDGVGIPPPSLASSPARLTFPDTVINRVSAPLRLTFRNVGVTPVTPGPPVFTGPFSTTTAALPTVANTCLGNLAVGATCFMDVVFNPTATGVYSGSLSLPFTGGVGSPLAVGLRGVGQPPFFPAIGVSADEIDFGAVVINVGASRTISVSSVGTGALSVLGVRTLQPIFSASTDCGRGIAPGNSCGITVTCMPTTLTRELGELYIDHDATGGFRRIQLACTGVPEPEPRIEVSATSIAFGNQTLGGDSPVQRVTIRSVGTSPLGIRAIGSEAPFAVQSDCPAFLAPGRACVAEIAFKPLGFGPVPGLLVIESNDPTLPRAEVTLGGIGCRPYTIQAGRRVGSGDLCSP